MFRWMYRTAKRLVRWSFWLLLFYLVYVLAWECPTGQSLTAVSDTVCPVLQHNVYPVVAPPFRALDERLLVSKTLGPVWASVHQPLSDFDNTYRVLSQVNTAFRHLQQFCVAVAAHASTTARYSWKYGQAQYRGSVRPVVRHYAAKANSHLQRLDVYRSVLRHLAKINAKLVAQREFLQSEVVKFMGRGGSVGGVVGGTDKGQMDVVSSILDDVVNHIDTARGSGEATGEGTGETTEESTGESTESTVSEASATSSESQAASLEADDEDLLEETITLTYTSTITAGFAAPSQELAMPDGNDVVEYGVDSSKAQLDKELEFWEQAVARTIELAFSNLDTDFEPVLTAKIDEYKEKLSPKFNQVPQDNHRRYQEMGLLIVAIDKDTEWIVTNQQIIEEPEVDRQIMRDKIKDATTAVEEAMGEIENIINEGHLEVLDEYFKVAQHTVDILESYADAVILDFSSKLTAAISVLQFNEDYTDDLGWAAWKRFHKVKESLFEARDRIMDEAHAFRHNAMQATVPRGLREWKLYLVNVNFHINYLLRDNAEYLRLVRAKANVAYQLREGHTRDLRRAAEAARFEAEASSLELESAASEASAQTGSTLSLVLYSNSSTSAIVNSEVAPTSVEVSLATSLATSLETSLETSLQTSLETSLVATPQVQKPLSDAPLAGSEATLTLLRTVVRTAKAEASPIPHAVQAVTEAPSQSESAVKATTDALSASVLSGISAASSSVSEITLSHKTPASLKSGTILTVVSSIPSVVLAPAVSEPITEKPATAPKLETRVLGKDLGLPVEDPLANAPPQEVNDEILSQIKQEAHVDASTDIEYFPEAEHYHPQYNDGAH